VAWRLDRFGRNLRQLVPAIEELAAAGVAFVSIEH
jgi:DNA invertase Pin-like site-specific DNA recombinase